MYIKNQKFSDEEMLLEMLFDFGLGTRTPYVDELVAEIDKDLAENQQYLDLLATMPDADDRAEVYEEERDIMLGEVLRERFSSFEVDNSRLYGVKGEERTLLFELDLY